MPKQDHNDPNPLNPAEEKRLVEVLNSLDISDKNKLSEALENLIRVRLSTEIKTAEGVGVGILSENIEIVEAVKLLNKSKDSLSDLVKIKRLVDGEDDSSIPNNVHYTWVTYESDNNRNPLQSPRLPD